MIACELRQFVLLILVVVTFTKKNLNNWTGEEKAFSPKKCSFKSKCSSDMEE